MEKNITIIKKNNHEVIISECFTIVKGSLKTRYIKETGQYFCTEKAAIRAANDLLLKKSLSKFRYEERKLEKLKARGAHKVINVYTCYQETEAYIKKWDGILYLETKKKLLQELKEKLDEVCVKYNFKTPHSAIGFIERKNNKKKII